MAAARHVGKLVEGFEEFAYDPVGNLKASPLEQIEPDRVNVADRFIAEMEGVQRASAPAGKVFGPESIQFLPRFLGAVDLSAGELLHGSFDLSIQSLAFFHRPNLIVLLGFEGTAEDILYA